jgi:hypothetical protein
VEGDGADGVEFVTREARCLSRLAVPNELIVGLPLAVPNEFIVGLSVAVPSELDA